MKNKIKKSKKLLKLKKTNGKISNTKYYLLFFLLFIILLIPLFFNSLTIYCFFGCIVTLILLLLIIYSLFIKENKDIAFGIKIFVLLIILSLITIPIDFLMIYKLTDLAGALSFVFSSGGPFLFFINILISICLIYGLLKFKKWAFYISLILYSINFFVGIIYSLFTGKIGVWFPTGIIITSELIKILWINKFIQLLSSLFIIILLIKNRKLFGFKK